MTLTRPLPQQELRDSRPRRRGSRGRTAAALLSVIAGGALSLAFDPVGASLLGPVSIAAFTVAVCLFADTARGGAVLGYLFGFAFLAAHVWWLKDSIGPGAWAAVTFVESLWFAAMGALIPLLRRLPAWPVLVAVMWSSVEVVRQMWPFGGFPWGQVGFTTVDTPVSAALPYVGVTGAGFIIALLATAVAYGVVAGRCNPRRAVLYLAAPLAMTVVPQLVPVDVARTGSVTVAVVQGDVPGSGDDVAGNHREISMAATAIQTPLLVGGIVDGPRPGTALNQGILWTESGPDGQAYTKQHPVPFGEFIPFRSLLDGLSPRLAEIPRDMLPGAEAEPLDIDTEEGIVRIADAICFDVAYADPIAQQVRSGAELVVVQTSNAMFTGTSQREQQFTMSRARALETGRTVIVASLNGISGIITADGEVLARLEERTTDTMLEEVATSRAATPAVRLMPVIDASLLGVAAIGAIWALIASSMGRLRARPDR
jgi:apolipoprotein N-acyltransferase